MSDVQRPSLPVRVSAGEAADGAYDRARASWAARWEEAFGRRTIQVDGWTVPWVDESWRDGNPIFSAWSPVLRRGVRVLHHDQADAFTYWEDTFGEGPDAVRELVIACALTEGSFVRARALWAEWAKGVSPRTTVVAAEPRDVFAEKLRSSAA